MILKIISMKMNCTFFLFTFLLGLQVCLAQSQQIIFNKVLLPEGRTFQNFTGITQDKLGYMWFASKNGLFRYDGYTFVTYKSNPSNPNSLMSNTLQCIYTDSS